MQSVVYIFLGSIMSIEITLFLYYKDMNNKLYNTGLDQCAVKHLSFFSLR